ncbi:uncharacterized protein [Argopecten irradians]|uniref:uncharacterized protein n=1 Tax=Argopecten irradians TaxID=31199 RepID=UPI0037145638
MAGNDEEPPEASLAISNILDTYGFSSELRRMKRTLCSIKNLYIDIYNIVVDLPSLGVEERLIGSLGEGLMELAMISGTPCDGDVMKILNKTAAYEDNNAVTVPHGHWQFQMKPCEKNIGYVKLTVVKEGSIFTPLSSTSNSCYYEYDEDKHVYYLSNGIPASLNNFGGNLNIFEQYNQNMQLSGVWNEQIVTGPSLSRVSTTEVKPGTFAIDKVDSVISIPCPKWPAVAEEWIERKRNYGWPSNDFITEHVKRGCYVVPVGCKECRKTYLDWRLSFVLVEQALVWDFNATQVKCLLLLKHLKKLVFEKEIGDIISSYILKTIVFWVIEETPPALWVPHRLLTAIHLCLDRLVAAVRNDFCPHFFIRICNLLAKRYTAAEKSKVLQLCQYARTNTLKLFWENPPFSGALQSRSVEEIASTSRDFSVLESKVQKLQSVVAASMNHLMSKQMRFSMSCLQSLQSTTEYCNTLSDKIRNVCLKHNMELKDMENISAEVERMRRRLLWTNNNLCGENTANIKYITVPQNTLTKYEALMENITICHLNAASGNFRLTYDMLRTLISTMQQVPYVRFQFPLNSFITGNNTAIMLDFLLKSGNSVLKGNDSYTLHLSDLLFLRFEYNCLPPPIQMEMQPSRRQNGPLDLSSGMQQTVAIDPVVYACFLKFWCCMKLERNIDMLKARDDMVWCCRLPDITNKAVAFNLLGYCHQQLEEYEAAFGAFCTAWNQRPHSDATLVHIFALVHSTIRRELNETCPD